MRIAPILLVPACVVGCTVVVQQVPTPHPTGTPAVHGSPATASPTPTPISGVTPSPSVAPMPSPRPSVDLAGYWDQDTSSGAGGFSGPGCVVNGFKLGSGPHPTIEFLHRYTVGGAARMPDFGPPPPPPAVNSTAAATPAPTPSPTPVPTPTPTPSPVVNVHDYGMVDILMNDGSAYHLFYTPDTDSLSGTYHAAATGATTGGPATSAARAYGLADEGPMDPLTSSVTFRRKPNATGVCIIEAP